MSDSESVDHGAGASDDERRPAAINPKELSQLREQGEEGLADLYLHYRPQFERMVKFRMDRRLYGRVDVGDILQEAYLEISRRIGSYLEDPPAPFFVWARQIAWQTLLMAHRHHLGAQKRNAEREIALAGPGDGSTSRSMAAQLVAHLTSPSQILLRKERHGQLWQALETMDEIDREVLALRHFEHLGNNEVASVLAISVKAASNRYVRALVRLKAIMEQMPDVADPALEDDAGEKGVDQRNEPIDHDDR